MQAIVETKTCLNCTKPVKGRADKKFCDHDCRNSYNNRIKYSDNSNLMRNINNSLRINRKAMKDILATVTEEKITVNKDKLQTLGFNFKYFTHLYTNRNNNTYFFCYDYGYMPLDNDRYLIVRQRDD